MLPLETYIQLQEQADRLTESEQTFFTDEQIEKAEFFNVKWNPVTGKTELYVYDANGEGLGSVDFDDEELAIAHIVEVFDLEEDDLLDLESYAWANDIDSKVIEVALDD